MTFEESNKRLEDIVKKLEQGNVSLEEGTKLFEEGVFLAKNCFEMINQSKGKIVEVTNELEKIVEQEKDSKNSKLPERDVYVDED